MLDKKGLFELTLDDVMKDFEGKVLWGDLPNILEDSDYEFDFKWGLQENSSESEWAIEAYIVESIMRKDGTRNWLTILRHYYIIWVVSF